VLASDQQLGQIASQPLSFKRGLKNMNITCREIGAVGRRVYKLPVIISFSLKLSVDRIWFIFLGPLKKPLNFRRFPTDADVMQPVTSCLQTLDSNFYYATIQASIPRQMSVVSTWRYDVYHVLPM